METQVFYWTGVIIWCLVCISTVCTVISAGVVAPIVAYTRMKKSWWMWITFAKFADIKWTEDELRNLATYANITDPLWFEKARRVLEKAEELRSDNGKV